METHVLIHRGCAFNVLYDASRKRLEVSPKTEKKAVDPLVGAIVSTFSKIPKKIVSQSDSFWPIVVENVESKDIMKKALKALEEVEVQPKGNPDKV